MPGTAQSPRDKGRGRSEIGYWRHYPVTNTGLYILDSDTDPQLTIDFYNFATGKISPVLTFDERPVRLPPSLSASADGKTLCFTQYDAKA